MGRKAFGLIYFLCFCILLAGCSLQRDTFEIVYPAAPGVVTTAPSAAHGSNSATVPTISETITVWVSTKGGTKYHCKQNCSGMTEATSLSLEAATQKGYTPCKRCYKGSE